jgi:hypothetical protein
VFCGLVAVLLSLFVPKKQAMRLLGGIVGIGFIIAVLWNTSLASGVVGRWNTSEDGELSGRITGSSVGQPILRTIADNPIGIGLGLYSGIAAYGGDSSELAYNEGAPNRIAAEAGLLGYAAMAAGLALILKAVFWSWKMEAARKTKLLPIAIGATIQIGLGVWYDHVGTALWWWLISLWFGYILAPQRALGPQMILCQVPRLVEQR